MDAQIGPITIPYGDHPSQVADLWLPDTTAPGPVVVLVHGGFWRRRWGHDLMDPLAADLAGRGWAAWNVEYRRLGEAGGGWPGTVDDVAAAVDVLASVDVAALVDRVARVVAVGHSAGGQLALWLASRRKPAVRVTAVVALAGMCDLRLGWKLGLGGNAVAALLGGSPETVPDRYRAASPAERVPLGVGQLLVHGTADELVPLEVTASYAAVATAAGDDVELHRIDAAGHFDVIDPTHPAWAAVVAFIARTSSATAPPTSGGTRS